MRRNTPTAGDVVVITTHDVGRHLHCYGVRSVSSPNLDRLAAEGVRFEGAFATAPQCSSSRASLATGRYPHNNGVMGLAHHGFDWELDPDVPHAAALFAGFGFETHLFGSQHVTLHPERLGFDHLHAPGPGHGNATGQILGAAVDQLLEAAQDDRRLFLEINFAETHRPYTAGGVGRSEEPAVPAYLPAGPEAVAEFTALEGTIAAMDEAAGRVLAALQKAGRAENTLVVFTTDHGLAMPRAKCTLYDPGLEVALILRWPRGGFDSGSTRSELVSNIDVLPTLLEAAGAPVPAGIQGRSLLPQLWGGDHESRGAIFAEKTFHSYYDPMRCIRTDRHKFIRNFETAFAVEVPGDIQRGEIFRADPARYSADRTALIELYDLESDPWEQHNLAGEPSTKSLEEELSGELWAWMRETNDPLLNGPVSSPRYVQAMEAGS